MIEILPDLPSGVSGFALRGHVTGDDYRGTLTPLLEELIDSAQPIRLVVVIGDDFDRFEAGALWEDTKFGMGEGIAHHSSWKRMALVSDADWVRHSISLLGWMVPGDVKVFALTGLDDAKAWAAAD